MYNQPIPTRTPKVKIYFFLRRIIRKIINPFTKCYICDKMKLEKNRHYITHRIWICKPCDKKYRV